MPKFKNPEDWKLEEPQKPQEKTLEDKILEIMEVEFRTVEERKTTKEPDYWQGKKDGLRIALAILEPEEKIWKRLTDSSPGFRLEEREALLELLKDARYNIGAALDDYAEKPNRQIHTQTIVNLLQWIDSYDRKAAKDEVPSTPDAITPDWGRLTGSR